MGKIVLVDDCQSPERWIKLKYSGPDPWAIAKKISDSIKPFFHVSSSGVGNSRINWDITGENISFYSVWWVKRKLSRYSSIKIYIKIQGEKNKVTNMGNFVLRLRGDVETKFEGWGLFVKPVWNIYSYLFYNKRKRQYIQQCRDFITSYMNEMKKNFNLEVAEETGPPLA